MKVAMKITMKFYDEGGKDGLRTTASELRFIGFNDLSILIQLFRPVLWGTRGWFCEFLTTRFCFPSPAIPF